MEQSNKSVNDFLCYEAIIAVEENGTELGEGSKGGVGGGGQTSLGRSEEGLKGAGSVPPASLGGAQGGGTVEQSDGRWSGLSGEHDRGTEDGWPGRSGPGLQGQAA